MIVISVHETRRFLHTSMSSSRTPSSESTKSLATMKLVQSIRAASRAIQNAAFVGSDSTEMMSYTRIVGTNTNVVTSAIVVMEADSSSTMSITILSRFIFERITSCALTGNVWKRSLLCSTLRWI